MCVNICKIRRPGPAGVPRELEGKGSALPWVDMVAFARQAVALSLEDRAAAEELPGRLFFDRGLVDAAVALQHATGESLVEALGQTHCYNKRLFLAPPWPEIYVTDRERQHGLADAIAEYHQLCSAYELLAYETHMLPKTSVESRADFVLTTLQAR